MHPGPRGQRLHAPYCMEFSQKPHTGSRTIQPKGQPAWSLHHQPAKCHVATLLSATLPSSLMYHCGSGPCQLLYYVNHPTSCAINCIIQILIITMGPTGRKRKGNIIITRRRRIRKRRRRRKGEDKGPTLAEDHGHDQPPEGHLSLTRQHSWPKVTQANAHNVL